MNKRRFSDLRWEFFTRRLKLWDKKNASYTTKAGTSEDTLDNFRIVARQLKIPPGAAAFVYLHKQLCSIATQLAGGTSAGEPIQQRCIDAANFLDVIYALDREAEEDAQANVERPQPSADAPPRSAEAAGTA